MDVTTAPVIRGVNNGCFYFRSEDADGTVHYTSQFGSNHDWVAFALTHRDKDWEISSHLAFVTSRY